jgi:hypothetical protein
VRSASGDDGRKIFQCGAQRVRIQGPRCNEPVRNLHLISAPYINLLISVLFRILHILSILTGPNIFLSICLSKMLKLFSSFAVKVQVSDQSVTTGLVIVLYIFILVLLFRNFDFISCALAQYALLPFIIP